MKNATIKINRRKERFAIIPTAILENTSLSWKAKGLLCYLLSRPEDWTIRVGDLINRSTDGRDAVKSALKELRQTGHAKLTQERNDRGHITGTVYQIFEIPISQPTDGKTVGREIRQTEKPSAGKSVDIIKNSLLNTINTNNKKERSEASLFSDDQPVFVLKKYLPEGSKALALPDQPSQKKLEIWLKTYSEDYLHASLIDFESFLKRPEKNKKNCAKKIKSAARTLDNWFKKKWIFDDDQRGVFRVFKKWWIGTIGAPLCFDFYKTSEDRTRLAEFTEKMIRFGKDPKACLSDLLENLPFFWKGKRLSSILKNYANIQNSIVNQSQKKGASASKQSATFENTDWI